MRRVVTDGVDVGNFGIDTTGHFFHCSVELEELLYVVHWFDLLCEVSWKANPETNDEDDRCGHQLNGDVSEGGVEVSHSCLT